LTGIFYRNIRKWSADLKENVGFGSALCEDKLDQYPAMLRVSLEAKSLDSPVKPGNDGGYLAFLFRAISAPFMVEFSTL
jgi:hypothetical protein